MKFLYVLLPLLCLFLGCKKSDDLKANKDAFDKVQFINPPVKYRSLKVLHDNLDTAIVARLKHLGYGGIVTNVSFENYLNSEDNWKKFEEVISYSIDTLGVRIWLYDELGYPSGAAGGLVLKEDPSLEAKGLAVIKKEIGSSENIFIKHPKGHGDVIFARAYAMIGSELDFEKKAEDLYSYLDKKGNLNWTAPDDGIKRTIFYFVEKPFYEGTHATHNWVAKRRYINVMKKKAAEKFVDLTHRQYYRHLGAYFGNGIEAFFTDEPSYLGTYFVGHDPPGSPPVWDHPDPELPLLLTLNWGDKFLAEFEQRRSYDLLSRLPYLVAGGSELTQQVRMDYYQTLAELFAENYFGTIKDFCDSTGVESSGHLLLEEHLFHHPIFEGDLMLMYKNMGYPGIDLLTAHPETAKAWGITMAKMASSVANFYGRKHVMSEISDAFDSDKADMLGRMASVGVQYAYGVDHFNSYYIVDDMTDDENRLFTDYIARVGYLLGQGKSSPSTALFYPIETIWANTYPSMSLEPYDFNSKAVELSDNFGNLAMSLVENQIEFNYLGSSQILESQVLNGKLCSSWGSCFSRLIIPAHSILTSDVEEKLSLFVESGGEIIIEDTSTNRIGEKAIILDNGEIPGYIKNHADLPIMIDGDCPDIISSCKHSENSEIYLFVNTGDEPHTFNVNSNSKGEKVRRWNPLSGDVESINAENLNDNLQFSVSLQKWETVIITVEL